MDENQLDDIDVADLTEPCEFCTWQYDHELLGRYGCPNCHGEGLDDDQGD